jgi:hypothetical protein
MYAKQSLFLTKWAYKLQQPESNEELRVNDVITSCDRVHVCSVHVDFSRLTVTSLIYLHLGIAECK